MPAAQRHAHDLRDDALTIWRSGVEAVDSERLVARSIRTWKNGLSINGTAWSARPHSRICVVGAGKAGAGMAAGLEAAVGPEWLSRITGWVNVPEDCVRPLQKIHLHGARPAGLNEPTAAGVTGTARILELVSELDPDDLCIVLISGGGSALLPAPLAGITLEDKQQVTRCLMRGGATIEELNGVRRALSQVKGGGLLRACRAGLLVTLIFSDVIGDPLETIASGPTINLPPDPKAALATLQRFAAVGGEAIPSRVIKALEQMSQQQVKSTAPICRAVQHVIGNNRVAVEAAARSAQRLGYSLLELKWDQPGEAANAGRLLAAQLMRLQEQLAVGAKGCVISGGETTVQLARTNGPQKGGRNQELVLAAAVEMLAAEQLQPFALLSGGTDGEDGPTDAAGAVIDLDVLQRIKQAQLDPQQFLSVNNSYPFFEQLDALIKTGPTHTNVMDLRVGLIGGEAVP
ncbi:glycerate kinase type-2 family protein [Planctomicrobium piriforme]|uniref:Hydroxypyruvate reductase n=1 Tax=Planctomicrobium piriforme TaxID=1576369 RepID=A0A1I3HXK8_9PLAN|nr:DUF4147 domain-containing protein [Planctomicrobium piriforme]SFI40486.1 hydroxypyruvate reductase [Planctomicrobium piriforme]